MKTRAELISEVLDKLGVLAAGQSPSAEDYNKVDGIINPVCDRLMRQKIYGFVDTEEFEDAPWLELSYILAYELTGPYGTTGDSLAKLVASGGPRGSAYTNLYRYSAVAPSYEPAYVNYF